MSEVQAPAAPAASCPVPLSTLPANFQKHVDPKAPVPLRMMGAKALVPMGPKEMSTALFMLTFDPEGPVRETAAKSASGLPDKILSVALRDETMDPLVLDYYGGILAALRAGDDAHAVVSAVARSPWGTGDFTDVLDSRF